MRVAVETSALLDSPLGVWLKVPGKELRMFDEHAQVVLKRPLPSLGLEPGAVGVIVHIYGEGAAYEVEFLSLDGSTIGVSTVEADDLRQASPGQDSNIF